MIEINRRQKNDARTGNQAHVLYPPLLYLTEEKVQGEAFRMIRWLGRLQYPVYALSRLQA